MRRRLSRFRPSRLLLTVLLLLVAGYVSTAAGAEARGAGASSRGLVLQTNLVSDQPGVAAVTDPNLVNPWGISESGTSPFWIADNNAGASTLYSVSNAFSLGVSINPLVVSIPTPVSPTGGAPTGTVFNAAAASGAFKVTGVNAAGQTTSAPAAFLFDTEDGTIVGWSPSINRTHALIAVDNSGNNFTNPDPNQQTGAVYKGLAIATSSVPIISTDANSTALPPNSDPVLLVGNFRDGHIDAFDSLTGSPLGQLRNPKEVPIKIDGLWSLTTGNGGAGGDANTVYFTAGPDGETHGLFGSLSTAAGG